MTPAGKAVALDLIPYLQRSHDAGVWDASYWLSSHKHDYRQAMSHAAKAASLNPDIAFQCLRIHTPLTV